MPAATVKTIAYADEVASLSDETAHDVGTTASAGVATDAARHDHVHVLGAGVVDAATLKNTAGVLAFQAVPTSAPAPEALVAGMVYLDSGDLKVCTVSYSA